MVAYPFPDVVGEDNMAQIVTLWNESGDMIKVEMTLRCEHGPMVVHNYQLDEDELVKVDVHCPTCGRVFKAELKGIN